MISVCVFKRRMLWLAASLGLVGCAMGDDLAPDDEVAQPDDVNEVAARLSANGSLGVLCNSIITHGTRNTLYYLGEFSRHTIKPTWNSIGGGSLQDHTRSAKSLGLVDRGPEVALLVEGSRFVFDPAKQTAASAHALIARARSAGSEPILYESYADQPWGATETNRLFSILSGIARAERVQLVPVGEAIAVAEQAYGNAAIYDGSSTGHIGPEGHFLAACVLHATLRGLRPAQITYAGDVAGLRHVAQSLAICRATIANHLP